MNRRMVVIGTIVASALGMSALVLVGGAAAGPSAAARYGVINATVDASTDHEVGTSTAFPNYTHGAVDNYYSLAHSHIDNSPFAEGTASPADSGPLGQTAAAGNFKQPQYADARWPGAKNGRSATVGNSGGPSGYAAAGSYMATALSSDASGSSPGGKMKIRVSKATAHRLRVLLRAWRSKWVSVLGLDLPKPNFADLPVTVPTVTTPNTPTIPTVTIPTVPTGTTTTQTTTTTSTNPSSSPQNGGLVAMSIAKIDPKSRAVVTSGHSFSGTVKIAAGQIILKNVDVTVRIVNAGKPKGGCSSKVGGATVGGVPVTIDQNGVHVAGQGSGVPYGQADSAMNAALKQAGVQLYTVKPQVTKSANQLTIDCTGVHASFSQPVGQSGVPSQTVDHIIGEVFVDSLASPAPKIPKVNFNNGGGSTFNNGGGSSSSSGGGSYGNNSSSSSGNGGNGSTSTPTSFLTAALSKPWWLLAAYLVWQAIVIATGASLWRWRTGAVTT